MKVIDRSAPVKQDRNPAMMDRVLSRLGQSWKQKEVQAEEAIIEALQKVLDNSFVMLRNVVLEGLDVPIPLVLVGPPGMWVIYASTSKGVFRAREDSWEELDDRTQQFKLARPNLLTRTKMMARAVETYLTTHVQHLPLIEPVLFFNDPGIHVDSTRPIVRIVQADALDRLVASFFQARVFLSQENLQRIVEALNSDRGQTQTLPEEQIQAAEAIPEKEDFFSFRDLPPEDEVRKSYIVIEDRSEPPLIKKIPFNRSQWIILGILILVNIVILMAFVVLILLSS